MKPKYCVSWKINVNLLLRITNYMFMLIVLTHILKATLTRRYLLESMLVLYLRGVKKEI